MTIDPSLIVVYLVIPVVIGAMAFMLKLGIQSMLNRLDTLEQRDSEKITKADFEIAMKDKLDPLREDVKDMKAAVDKVYDRLLNKE